MARSAAPRTGVLAALLLALAAHHSTAWPSEQMGGWGAPSSRGAAGLLGPGALQPRPQPPAAPRLTRIRPPRYFAGLSSLRLDALLPVR